MTNMDVNFKVVTDQKKQTKGPAWLKISWQTKHVKPDPLIFKFTGLCLGNLKQQQQKIIIISKELRK